MSFRCRSFLPHQIVVDILVVGISEGLVRHPVLEYIADALNRLASCLVVVEEAMDVGVTVKVMQCLTPAPNGKVASQAVDYLYPYYLNPESWKFKQIKPFDQSRAAILLYEAGTALGNQKYIDTAKRIGLKYSTSDVETIPYLILKRK